MGLPCTCCDGSRPAAAVLRSGTLGSDARGWQAPLCLDCLDWLTGTVTAVRSDWTLDAPLAGVPSPPPSPAGAARCHLCRGDPGSSGALIECEAVRGAVSPWLPLAVCHACAAWVGSLAASGTSARRRSKRGLDGPYGHWLHPALRAAAVVVAADSSCRRAIADACRAMGVRLLDLPAPGAVLFFDAGIAAARVRGWAGVGVRPVAVVPFGAWTALRGALQSGACGWVTSPLTPQQVTGALVRALRNGRGPGFDPAACLPAVADPASLPDVLFVTPAPGVSTIELAWLLRRFARGYDEVAVVRGQLLVVPRVPEARVHRVAARLQSLLRGRCTVTVVAAGAAAGPGFEAAG